MANIDDETLINLIARCALRDQSALKQLYDLVGSYLNTVAFRIMRSNDVSSEVLQEGFLQIWQNAGTYRPHESKPLTWMTSIIRYRALDRLDHECRRTKHLTRDNDDLDSIKDLHSEETPERSTEQCLVSRHIASCMKLLNANTQRSIELAYIYGFSREEVATQLDTNSNTVKSWLRRGGERLRECLENNFKVSP